MRRCRTRDFEFLHLPKQREGIGSLVPLPSQSILHQGIQKYTSSRHWFQILFPADILESVKGTTQRQRLQTFSIDLRKIGSLHKVIDGLIWSMIVSFLNDGEGSRCYHALDTRQTETYSPLCIHAEVSMTFVDIRQQGGNSHAFTFVHEFCHFLDIVFPTC